MRNVEKQIEQGNNVLSTHKQLDLSLSEIDQLYKKYLEMEKSEGKATAVLKIIGAAYSFGLAVGVRN